jgi:hypothetical protein
MKTTWTRPRTAALALALAVALASLGLGFVLTHAGVATWDSLPHLQRSRWLLQQYGLRAGGGGGGPPFMLRWYGALWALLLGVMSEIVFGFLRDPTWVEHAVNFALFPAGLALTFRLLARAGVDRSTALLAVAMLFGMIRLGGHALLNVNDFPFAMSYLLVTLYGWVALRDGARAAGGYRWTVLARVGIACAIPTLIRPPVAVHLVTLAAFLIVQAAWGRAAAPVRRRLALVLVPLGAAALFIWALSPAIWGGGGAGWRGWGAAVVKFASFPWKGGVRFFGHGAAAASEPRWYALVWLPVILNPVVFLALLAGLLAPLRGGAQPTQSFVLDTRRGPFDLSLRRWLALHAAAAWAGVMLIHPVLYDEERHILFLYPPLLVLAALGLDRLSARKKQIVAALAIGVSLVSYARWGRYSYVYESPLIGRAQPDRFTGDYWGACVPLAVTALGDVAPPGADVFVRGPYDAAAVQYQRLREGRLTARPGFGPYHLVAAPPLRGRYFAVAYNRSDPGSGRPDNQVELDAVRAGQARLLWRAPMPGSQSACVIVEHPPPVAATARAP